MFYIETGYAAAALLAILFCIPFALRVLIHKENGRWSNWPQAFYHAHLELFLGNACLGNSITILSFKKNCMHFYCVSICNESFLNRRWRDDAAGSDSWTLCQRLSSWTTHEAIVRTTSHNGQPHTVGYIFGISTNYISWWSYNVSHRSKWTVDLSKTWQSSIP